MSDQKIADLTEKLIQAQAETTQLKEALEAVDDHGRALSFVETIKGRDAEIHRLNIVIGILEAKIASLEENTPTI